MSRGQKRNLIDKLIILALMFQFAVTLVSVLSFIRA